MEQKPDKSLKNSLLLVIVGVTLFVALQHLNLVAGALSMMIGLVMPLIAGGIIAFILNVPMSFFEKKIEWLNLRHPSKLLPRIKSALSLIVTLVLVALAICFVGRVIFPNMAESIKSIAAIVNDNYQSWIALAESYGLESRERMAGALRPELSLAARREMLLYRGAVTSNDFTRESIERALVAAGFRASVTEYGGNQNLYVNCLELLDASITAERAMAAAAEFLPAHLGCDYDFSPLTWTWIEQKEWTFAQMDAKDLSWQQIDAGEVV